MTEESASSRPRRRIWRVFPGLALFLGLVAGMIAWAIYGSLPKTSGTIALAGLSAPVTIARDAAGVVTITAANQGDATFALGFVHAQDRMFQMEAMRRLGAGRLSEVFGAATLRADKLMRLLGLARQAAIQYDKASPELRSALETYASGVNAFLETQWLPPPPDFALLMLKPEPWKPTDSLLWGRIMAWQLSGNAGSEIQNEQLRQAVSPYLLPLLLREESKQAALPGFAPSRSASNNWALSGSFTESGKPILANDPHLGLSAPATWYMARIITPERTLVGATAPGLPFLVIGSNGKVAWGFTTTHGDTQDLYLEKLLAEPAGHYRTPGGSAPIAARREVIKVKDEADVTLDVRVTRHGPLISDLDPERYLKKDYSIAWSGFWSDDRTPESFLRMNQAENASSFRDALRDFHTPQQNVVFADINGAIGFIAAGRVPVRKTLHARSLFPVPGWLDTYDWAGQMPFDQLPRLSDPLEGMIVTANNDIRPEKYRWFLGYNFDRPYRRDRITQLLTPLSAASIGDMERIQMDDVSAPVLDFVKTHLEDATSAVPLDVSAALAGWDGRMTPDRPEPLIAIAWIHATAQRLLADDLGDKFDDWWFWQTDILEAAMRDPRWCDDTKTEAPENCREQLRAALSDAIDRLRVAYGPDWQSWRWGAAHAMSYRHPVFSRVPLIGDKLVPQVPAMGDQFTISRAGMAIGEDGAHFPDVHGPGMRMVVDLAQPEAPVFNLAGGQSGHPLSPHYSDLLLEWAAGTYRTFQEPARDTLTLQPERQP